MGLLEAVDRLRASFRDEVRKAIARDEALGLPPTSIHDDKAFADRSHRWGPFASDPRSDDLDLVKGPVWEAAVEAARRSRLALTRVTKNVAGDGLDAPGPQEPKPSE